MKTTVLCGVACLLSSIAQALEVQYPLDNYAPGSFQGRVFSCCSRRHLGEDHAATPLTPVYAIADGQVLTAEASGAHCNFGMVVIIEHTLDDRSKFISLYGHLSNRSGYRPRLNGAVRKGEVIGYVGHSGGLPPRRDCRRTRNPDDENGDGGPHLHFAIRLGAGPRRPNGRYEWIYPGYAGNFGQDVDFDASGNPHGGLFTNPSRFLEELGVGDADSDGWSVSEGDCMDEGETPEGVPASAVHPGAEEVCNYVDDDCDGTIDEGFDELLMRCFSEGLGACRRAGVYVCTSDFTDLTCSIGSGIPSPEVCDGADNDCDGTVDDGVLNACGSCGTVPPETCNGVDDDCDGFVDDGVPDCWLATTLTGAPFGTPYHTAVWTGSEIIFCCYAFGRYNPASDTWATVAFPPSGVGRAGHTAIWTGSEMIVWGGNSDNTGFRYNPAIDSWEPTQTDNAPFPRNNHTAVWTGSEMIVWGGRYGGALYSGGKYNPITDTWVALSMDGAPSAREGHTAIWTGSEMIIWGGGASVANSFNTGGRYDPVLDNWTTTSTTDAPSARQSHTAVWTGSEMIVWGGATRWDGSVGTWITLETGKRYDPSTNTWATLPIAGNPGDRLQHTAIWTGSGMIIWGGRYDANGAIGSGGIYDLEADVWMPLVSENAPSGRYQHTATWTGTEMIVWGGGYFTPGVVPCCWTVFNTGGRYTP